MTEIGTRVLTMTRELLRDEDSWTKNHFEITREDGTKCRCLVGAVSSAIEMLFPESSQIWDMKEYDEKTAYNETRTRLCKAISSIDGRERVIVWWNDSPGTTHEMVLKALDMAIEDV